MDNMVGGVEIESEIVRLARVARSRYAIGRSAGFELALVTAGHPEIGDAFLLDLPDAPLYGAAAGQPSAADWDWYLNH